MKIISNDTIEIEAIPEDSDPVSRKSYRLPLRGKDNFVLEVNAVSYPLLDISTEGVCVAIQESDQLFIDGNRSVFKMILGDKIFADLEGDVVHTSLDCEEGWICGIHWQNLDEETSENLSNTLLELRKEMFENA